MTTLGYNLGVVNSLGREFGTLTALLLCLSVPGFDAGILAMFGLPPRRLPAANLPQALRLLAIVLIRAPWPILAPAPFAQADPRARPAPSGRAIVLSRTLARAHGRCFLPRESSERMR